jgi:hypothetical protein
MNILNRVRYQQRVLQETMSATETKLLKYNEHLLHNEQVHSACENQEIKNILLM